MANPTTSPRGEFEDERQIGAQATRDPRRGHHVFLRNGYLGTSMDEIAALAGVSKQTVYKHFADKERLFSEIVTAVCDEIADPNIDEVQT